MANISNKKRNVLLQFINMNKQMCYDYQWDKSRQETKWHIIPKSDLPLLWWDFMKPGVIFGIFFDRIQSSDFSTLFCSLSFIPCLYICLFSEESALVDDVVCCIFQHYCWFLLFFFYSIFFNTLTGRQFLHRYN